MKAQFDTGKGTSKFEFVVPASPFSVNIARKQTRKHREWKDLVGQSAESQHRKEGISSQFPLEHPIEIDIITYFTTQARDVDNVIKPILDGLKNVLYKDDVQVYKVCSQRVDLKVRTVLPSSGVLVDTALELYDDFVHITIFW